MASYATSQIQTWISDYVGEFLDFSSPDSYQSAPLDWRQSRLRPNILQQKFGLPFIVQGTIGRIHVSIPLNVFQSHVPIEVTIRDAWFLITLQSPDLWDLQTINTVEQQTRAAVLSRIWDKLASGVTTDQSNGETKDGMTSAIMNKLLGLTLAKLRIDIRNVHIRFEMRPDIQLGLSKCRTSPLLGPSTFGIFVPFLSYSPPRKSSAATDNVDRELHLVVHLYWRSNDCIVYSDGQPSIGPFDPVWLETRQADQPEETVVFDESVKSRVRVLRTDGIPNTSESSFRGGTVPDVPKRVNAHHFSEAPNTLESLFLSETGQLYEGDMDVKRLKEYIVQTTESIMRADRLSLIWKAPDTQADASIGVTFKIPSLSINVPRSMISTSPFLLHYLQRYSHFVKQTAAMIPILPKLCKRPCVSPCRESAKDWWQYARRCIHFCRATSKTKNFWPFQPYAIHLLKQRSDYLILLRGFKAAQSATMVFKSLAEGMKIQIEEIESDVSIPRELLILWKRLALRDPTLSHSVFCTTTSSDADIFESRGASDSGGRGIGFSAASRVILQTCRNISRARLIRLAEHASKATTVLPDNVAKFIQSFLGDGISSDDITRLIHSHGHKEVNGDDTVKKDDDFHDAEDDLLDFYSQSEGSEDEEDGLEERGFSFQLPRHLYIQSLHSTVTKIYANTNLPRVINDFGKGVAREFRQRFGKEEKRDAQIHQAARQLLNDEGVDIEHLPHLDHQLGLYLSRKFRFYFALEVETVEISLGTSPIVSSEDWLIKAQRLNLFPAHKGVTAKTPETDGGLEGHRRLLGCRLNAVVIEIGALSRLDAEIAVFSDSPVDVVGSMTVASIDVCCPSMNRKKEVPMLWVETRDTESLFAVSLGYFGPLGSIAETGKCTLRLSKDVWSALGGLEQWITSSQNFWVAFVKDHLLYSTHLRVPAPVFQWLPSPTWTAALDEISTDQFNQKLYRAWVAVLSEKGLPLSLREGQRVNEAVTADDRDKPPQNRLLHSLQSALTVDAAESLEAWKARWKEPVYLTAPSSRYRLRCDCLCLAWCPNEERQETPVRAILFDVPPPSPMASTEEASLLIKGDTASEEVASHWVEETGESAEFGPDDLLPTPSVPRPSTTFRMPPEDLTCILFNLNEIVIDLSTPACPTGSTSASLKIAYLEVSHRRGLPARGPPSVPVVPTPLVSPESAPHSAEASPPPAEIPDGHGAAWHLLHRSFSRAVAIKETPHLIKPEGDVDEPAGDMSGKSEAGEEKRDGDAEAMEPPVVEAGVLAFASGFAMEYKRSLSGHLGFDPSIFIESLTSITLEHIEMKLTNLRSLCADVADFRDFVAQTSHHPTCLALSTFDVPDGRLQLVQGRHSHQLEVLEEAATPKPNLNCLRANTQPLFEPSLTLMIPRWEERSEDERMGQSDDLSSTIEFLCLAGHLSRRLSLGPPLPNSLLEGCLYVRCLRFVGSGDASVCPSPRMMMARVYLVERPNERPRPCMSLRVSGVEILPSGIILVDSFTKKGVASQRFSVISRRYLFSGPLGLVHVSPQNMPTTRGVTMRVATASRDEFLTANSTRYEDPTATPQDHLSDADMSCVNLDTTAPVDRCLPIEFEFEASHKFGVDLNQWLRALRGKRGFKKTARKKPTQPTLILPLGNGEIRLNCNQFRVSFLHLSRSIALTAEGFGGVLRNGLKVFPHPPYTAKRLPAPRASATHLSLLLRNLTMACMDDPQFNVLTAQASSLLRNVIVKRATPEETNEDLSPTEYYSIESMAASRLLGKNVISLKSDLRDELSVTVYPITISLWPNGVRSVVQLAETFVSILSHFQQPVSTDWREVDYTVKQMDPDEIAVKPSSGSLIPKIRIRVGLPFLRLRLLQTTTHLEIANVHLAGLQIVSREMSLVSVSLLSFRLRGPSCTTLVIGPWPDLLSSKVDEHQDTLNGQRESLLHSYWTVPPVRKAEVNALAQSVRVAAGEIGFLDCFDERSIGVGESDEDNIRRLQGAIYFSPRGSLPPFIRILYHDSSPLLTSLANAVATASNDHCFKFVGFHILTSLVSLKACELLLLLDWVSDLMTALTSSSLQETQHRVIDVDTPNSIDTDSDFTALQLTPLETGSGSDLSDDKKTRTPPKIQIGGKGTSLGTLSIVIKGISNARKDEKPMEVKPIKKTNWLVVGAARLPTAIFPDPDPLTDPLVSWNIGRLNVTTDIQWMVQLPPKEILSHVAVASVKAEDITERSAPALTRHSVSLVFDPLQFRTSSNFGLNISPAHLRTSDSATINLDLWTDLANPFQVLEHPRRYLTTTLTLPELHVNAGLYAALKINKSVASGGPPFRVAPLQQSGYEKLAPFDPPMIADLDFRSDTFDDTKTSITEFEQINTPSKIYRDLLEVFTSFPKIEWKSTTKLEGTWDTLALASLDSCSILLTDVSDNALLKLKAVGITAVASMLGHYSKCSVETMEFSESISQQGRDTKSVLRFVHPPEDNATSPHVPKPDISWSRYPTVKKSCVDKSRRNGDMTYENRGNVKIHSSLNPTLSSPLQTNDMYPCMESLFEIKDPLLSIDPSFLGVLLIFLFERHETIPSSLMNPLSTILNSRVMSVVTGMSALVPEADLDKDGPIQQTWPHLSQIQFELTKCRSDKIPITKQSTVFDCESINPTRRSETTVTAEIEEDEDSHSDIPKDDASLFDSVAPLGTRGSIPILNDKHAWAKRITGYHPEGWNQQQQRGQYIHNWQRRIHEVWTQISLPRLRRRDSSRRLFPTGSAHASVNLSTLRQQRADTLKGYLTLHELYWAIARLRGPELMSLMSGLLRSVNLDRQRSELNITQFAITSHFSLKIERINFRLSVPGIFDKSHWDTNVLSAQTVYAFSTSVKVKLRSLDLGTQKTQEENTDIEHCIMSVGVRFDVDLRDTKIQSWIENEDPHEGTQNPQSPQGGCPVIRDVISPIQVTATFEKWEPYAAKVFVEAAVPNGYTDLQSTDPERNAIAALLLDGEMEMPLWHPVMHLAFEVSKINLAVSLCDIGAFSALANWLRPTTLVAQEMSRRLTSRNDEATLPCSLAGPQTIPLHTLERLLGPDAAVIVARKQDSGVDANLLKNPAVEGDSNSHTVIVARGAPLELEVVYESVSLSEEKDTTSQQAVDLVSLQARVSDLAIDPRPLNIPSVDPFDTVLHKAKLCLTCNLMTRLGPPRSKPRQILDEFETSLDLTSQGTWISSLLEMTRPLKVVVEASDLESIVHRYLSLRRKMAGVDNALEQGKIHFWRSLFRYGRQRQRLFQSSHSFPITFQPVSEPVAASPLCEREETATPNVINHFLPTLSPPMRETQQDEREGDETATSNGNKKISLTNLSGYWLVYKFDKDTSNGHLIEPEAKFDYTEWLRTLHKDAHCPAVIHFYLSRPSRYTIKDGLFGMSDKLCLGGLTESVALVMTTMKDENSNLSILIRVTKNGDLTSIEIVSPLQIRNRSHLSLQISCRPLRGEKIQTWHRSVTPNTDLVAIPSFAVAKEGCQVQITADVLKPSFPDTSSNEESVQTYTAKLHLDWPSSLSRPFPLIQYMPLILKVNEGESKTAQCQYLMAVRQSEFISARQDYGTKSKYRIVKALMSSLNIVAAINLISQLPQQISFSIHSVERQSSKDITALASTPNITLHPSETRLISTVDPLKRLCITFAKEKGESIEANAYEIWNPDSSILVNWQELSTLSSPVEGLSEDIIGRCECSILTCRHPVRRAAFFQCRVTVLFQPCLLRRGVKEGGHRSHLSIIMSASLRIHNRMGLGLKAMIVRGKARAMPLGDEDGRLAFVDEDVQGLTLGVAQTDTNYTPKHDSRIHLGQIINKYLAPLRQARSRVIDQTQLCCGADLIRQESPRSVSRKRHKVRHRRRVSSGPRNNLSANPILGFTSAPELPTRDRLMLNQTSLRSAPAPPSLFSPLSLPRLSPSGDIKTLMGDDESDVASSTAPVLTTWQKVSCLAGRKGPSRRETPVFMSPSMETPIFMSPSMETPPLVSPPVATPSNLSPPAPPSLQLETPFLPPPPDTYHIAQPTVDTAKTCSDATYFRTDEGQYLVMSPPLSNDSTVDSQTSFMSCKSVIKELLGVSDENETYCPRVTSVRVAVNDGNWLGSKDMRKTVFVTLCKSKMSRSLLEQEEVRLYPKSFARPGSSLIEILPVFTLVNLTSVCVVFESSSCGSLEVEPLRMVALVSQEERASRGVQRIEEKEIGKDEFLSLKLKMIARENDRNESDNFVFTDASEKLRLSDLLFEGDGKREKAVLFTDDGVTKAAVNVRVTKNEVNGQYIILVSDIDPISTIIIDNQCSLISVTVKPSVKVVDEESLRTNSVTDTILQTLGCHQTPTRRDTPRTQSKYMTVQRDSAAVWIAADEGPVSLSLRGSVVDADPVMISVPLDIHRPLIFPWHLKDSLSISPGETGRCSPMPSTAYESQQGFNSAFESNAPDALHFDRLAQDENWPQTLCIVPKKQFESLLSIFELHLRSLRERHVNLSHGSLSGQPLLCWNLLNTMFVDNEGSDYMELRPNLIARFKMEGHCRETFIIEPSIIGTTRMIRISLADLRAYHDVRMCLSSDQWKRVQNMFTTRLRGRETSESIISSLSKFHLGRLFTRLTGTDILIRDHHSQRHPIVSITARQITTGMQLGFVMPVAKLLVTSNGRENFSFQLKDIRVSFSQARPAAHIQTRHLFNDLTKGASQIKSLHDFARAITQERIVARILGLQSMASLSGGSLQDIRRDVSLRLGAFRVNTNISTERIANQILAASLLSQDSAIDLRCNLLAHREIFYSGLGSEVRLFAPTMTVPKIALTIQPMLLILPAALILDNLRPLLRIFLSADLRWPSADETSPVNQARVSVSPSPCLLSPISSIHRPFPTIVQAVSVSGCTFKLSATAIGLEIPFSRFVPTLLAEASSPIAASSITHKLMASSLLAAFVCAAATLDKVPVELPEFESNQASTVPILVGHVTQLWQSALLSLCKSIVFNTLTTCKSSHTHYSVFKLIWAVLTKDAAETVKALQATAFAQQAPDLIGVRTDPSVTVYDRHERLDIEDDDSS